MKKTQEEINQEIAALQKLKPIGKFAYKTAGTISVQIDTLKSGLDDTCEEWEELSDEQQDAARDADNWKNGDTKEKPSEGWGGLCE